jgi:hypothetical protein
LIELINPPFLFKLKGTPDEYNAGLKLVIGRGCMTFTIPKFTQAGAVLFA